MHDTAAHFESKASNNLIRSALTTQKWRNSFSRECAIKSSSVLKQPFQTKGFIMLDLHPGNQCTHVGLALHHNLSTIDYLTALQGPLQLQNLSIREKSSILAFVTRSNPFTPKLGHNVNNIQNDPENAENEVKQTSTIRVAKQLLLKLKRKKRCNGHYQRLWT